MSKEKTGVLFVNDKKQAGSNQPDYRGKITIDGQELNIVGWKKIAKNDSAYLSLKIDDPMDQRPESDKYSNNDSPW